ncbi:FtsX-like permease family protein [Algoriphagus sp. CAU 1675]|uniref:FtsX-like permease family protein n=1 Tax=Algoriphagus sp. CAU 1675 TaxID=3032597 RepID=UPI0023D9AB61|nr:FtsX-like permease family protein [Algoriphagus sp. CAU 1675]MDF2158124.1 ABC transporter permease [Algoriphagus sp. CAU 1675]
MWKNYLKISYRNLKKRKLYTGINLLGLTIAIVGFLSISLFIHHEWNYDRMYSGAERIYKLNQEFAANGETQLVGSTPSSLIPVLIDEFPEVETGTLVFDLGIFSSVVVDGGQGSQEEKSFAFVDENFFRVFDFELLVGDGAKVLDEPNQLVLTESTAKRYFGFAQAAFQNALKIDGKEYLVTGVMEDFPSNSHLDFDFLASFKTHRHGKNPEWSPSNYYSYVKLKEGSNRAEFETKLPQMVEKYLGDIQEEYGFKTSFLTQPVTEIHLGDQSLSSIKPGSDVRYLYIFGVVAILLIAIGVINYVNLATAEATERNKEVGLRKVMGAERVQLFGQFVSESMILSFLATGLSILCVFMLGSRLSDLVGFQLKTDLLLTPGGILFLIFLVLIIGILAGFYPSLLLAGMQPIKALGNKVKTGGTAWVRKSLVVFQFFVSTGLLIATFVVKSQLNFMQDVNLGYEKEHLIALNYTNSMEGSVEVAKQEMIRSGAAVSASIASDMPVFIKAGYKVFPGGDFQGEFMITGYSVDQDLSKTIGLELLAGVDLNRNDLNRSQAYEEGVDFPVLINESALKATGWSAEEAIGKRVNFGGSMARIKGVVKNFYFNSLHYEVNPLAVFLDPNQANVFLVKLPEGDVQSNLNKLKATWEGIWPDRPFTFQFVDQAYEQQYQSEQRSGLIFGVFSGIVVLIACMGLFGLVSYVALRRTREISIRKVLGATQGDVLTALSADFLKLLGISALLAVGFGIWFTDSWLSEFANQAEVGVIPYLLAILIVLVLAFGTIAYRSWKVYSLNPSETLKND